MTTDIQADALIADLRQRVRERLRRQVLQRGGSPALHDPEIFVEVEQMLRGAAQSADAADVLLSEVLGDPATWRLQTAMHYQSHRSTSAASAIIFVKRRVLMPVLRWLFEYSRDNFERQQRVNLVLFACVQELAAETARLRQQLQQQPGATARGADAATDSAAR